MNPIYFISALDGKILLHTKDEIVKRSANVDELAGVLVKHGTKNCIISSSVEFSDEDGFPDNDAMDIVEKAIDKAKEIRNKSLSTPWRAFDIKHESLPS